MKPKSKKRWRLLALCYTAGLVVWLAVCGVHLALDMLHTQKGQMPYLELSLEDAAETKDVYWEDPQRLVTVGADPQLIFELPAGSYAGRFVFSGSHLRNGPGEMAVYYAAEGEPFSEKQKLWLTQTENGSWMVDLGGRKISRIRFDIASISGSIWQVEHFAVNPFKPAAAYFVPSVQTVALLLLAPLLVWAAISEAIAFFQPIFSRRRLERRWRQA